MAGDHLKSGQFFRIKFLNKKLLPRVLIFTKTQSYNARNEIKKGISVRELGAIHKYQIRKKNVYLIYHIYSRIGTDSE